MTAFQNTLSCHLVDALLLTSFKNTRSSSVTGGGLPPPHHASEGEQVQTRPAMFKRETKDYSDWSSHDPSYEDIA